MTTAEIAATAMAVERMAEAADAFLTALEPGQRLKAQMALNDRERQRLSYIPPILDHAGLELGELNGSQYRAAQRLIRAGLSLHGYAEVTSVIALDDVARADRPDARADPRRYHLTVFGPPGPRASWAWRLQGHHVSLNYTLAEGRLVAPTPSFLGAHPCEVKHGDRVVVRLLGEQQDLGHELLASLDAGQRAHALLSSTAPPDIVTGNVFPLTDSIRPSLEPLLSMMGPVSDAAREQARSRLARGDKLSDPQREALAVGREPKGLAGAAMSEAQRARLETLVSVYLDRMPGEIAAAERARLERAGLGAVHFAWAGSLARGEPHYFRLHGPTFLAEHDTALHDPTHLHSVWRDPQRDFGRDLLGEHYSQAH